jgi:hypothetical protein
LALDSPKRARIYPETLCAGSVAAAELLQPRIEPEVVLGADLAQGAVDAIATAVEWAAAGLEVVQCHFDGWEMTPAEAVAEAGLHAALAIGPRREVDAAAVHGLAAARCDLLCDAVLVATGRGTDGPPGRPAGGRDRDHGHADPGPPGRTRPAVAASTHRDDRA